MWQYVALQEYEKAQRDQLGRHVIEEQNRQYLMGRTTKKVDIIDPTGRSLRVDPSQVRALATLPACLGGVVAVVVAVALREGEKHMILLSSLDLVLCLQVTTIVDRAFGLGYNPRKDPEQMKQILDLVRY